MKTSGKHSVLSTRVEAGRIRRNVVAYLRLVVELCFIFSAAVLIVSPVIALHIVFTKGFSQFMALVAHWSMLMLYFGFFSLGCGVALSTLLAAISMTMSSSTLEEDVYMLPFVKDGFMTSCLLAIGRGMWAAVTFPFRLLADIIPWWKGVSVIFPKEHVARRFPRIPN
ncbi:MAG: hypothetical protein HGB18_02455 [Candidatus Moranbacteria bacterium]|nr:hypothetical protein [Candidatus Moranbacteria bacterium]